ncbi:hypothetical protein [Helicobacter equorum]|uniref:hypothetical protein n=1 Tax=Helicobacter equorum TaxID=361872 RepID=UPI001F473A3A|nr:hypothetical protein [Helicobacter equorum]
MQHTLQRFQVTHNTLCVFSGVGRSFYICAQCYQDPKALRGVMRRYNIQQITESKGV